MHPQLLRVHAQLLATSLRRKLLLYAICEFTGGESTACNPPAPISSPGRFCRPDTFSWSILIRSHAWSSPTPIKAHLSFAQMRQNRILTDHYPYTFVLEACASVPCLLHGEWIDQLLLTVRAARLRLLGRCAMHLGSRMWCRGTL